MKFTLSWLKDHLATTVSLETILQTLTRLGLEVDKTEEWAKKLQGLVVAEVVGCQPHPNADRLSVCQVDNGSGTLIQVICGAPNVYKGIKTAFAFPGQIIPATNQTLKKGHIRGIESCGMLCSAQELGLGQESSGILELQTTLLPGAPLVAALALDDPVITLTLTPNRSDCFAVRGIARDLAAAGLGTLRPWPYQLPQTLDHEEQKVEVTIADPKACPLLVARLIKGVRNQPSPQWVQARLKAIGLRPISALVDVTNYLTYDLGRPLHVFDAAKIHGSLQVKLSQGGEEFIGLNEKSYILGPGMIIVSDEKKVLALAGVMGGLASACTDSTTDVLVESALFDPLTIAITARDLNILSDAKARFERGVDSALVTPGIEAATELIVKWCGGQAGQLIVQGTPPEPQPPVTLSLQKLQGLSGMELSLAEAQEVLIGLDFKVVRQTSRVIEVKVPSWRHDITDSVDLIEEILRIKGYDTIPAIPLPHQTSPPPEPAPLSLSKKLLLARGLNEVVTWSYLSEPLAQLFAGSESLHLSNPISPNLAVMRPSLLPSLMLIVQYNQARGCNALSLFEVGPQFHPDHTQQTVITGIRAGCLAPAHWGAPQREVDVFDVKGDVWALVDTGQLEATAPAYYHPSRCGTLRRGPKVLAYFGELHPQVIKYLDIKGPVMGFELFPENYLTGKQSIPSLILSPYPAVERDFAFVVDKKVLADELLRAIHKAEKQLITAITLWDIYEGEPVSAEKKSLTFRVRLQSRERTLTDQDITEISQKIIAQVALATGGTLR